MSPLVEERLSALDTISLKSGGHESLQDGACALELVSYLAGEPWSDHPECVCPTLGAFFRSWNDGLPNADRDRLLKPFLTRLIGTRGTPQLAEARGFMALDWLVRVHTPAWLDLRPELQSHAQALRALEALRDTPSVLSSRAPYVDKGRYYRIRSVDYDRLGAWCRRLPGQTIVCEQAGATWLPFRPLATIKSTRGTSEEVVWTSGCYFGNGLLRELEEMA